jgi:hypothetical protein
MTSVAQLADDSIAHMMMGARASKKHQQVLNRLQRLSGSRASAILQLNTASLCTLGSQTTMQGDTQRLSDAMPKPWACVGGGACN